MQNQIPTKIPTRIPTRIRRERKRSAFSQKEIAFLLGFESGAQISRFERFTRVPSLEAALACRVLFDASMPELFPGLYDDVERNIRNRAQMLLDQLSKQNNKSRKRICLRLIING